MKRLIPIAALFALAIAGCVVVVVSTVVQKEAAPPAQCEKGK